MKVILQRYIEDDTQTNGTLTVLNSINIPIFTCVTLERGDHNNQRNISNIPPGIYDLEFEWSPKFRCNLWELKGIPNRSEVKIHASNYWHELNGCIALGSYLAKINKDSYLDVAASRRTLKDFHRVMDTNEINTIQVIDPIIDVPF